MRRGAGGGSDFHKGGCKRGLGRGGGWGGERVRERLARGSGKADTRGKGRGGMGLWEVGEGGRRQFDNKSRGVMGVDRDMLPGGWYVETGRSTAKLSIGSCFLSSAGVRSEW